MPNTARCLARDGDGQHFCELDAGHSGVHAGAGHEWSTGRASPPTDSLLPPLTYEKGYKAGFYDGALLALAEIEKQLPSQTTAALEIAALRDRFKAEWSLGRL